MSNLENKTVEFHILHSFPVNCLNRGENGELKTAMIGGAVRQRISSQSWKRAIRQEMLKHNAHGKKVVSIQLQEMIRNELVKQGCPDNKIAKILDALHKFYGDLQTDPKKDKLLVHVSLREIEAAVAACAANGWNEKTKFEDAIMSIRFEDDIALFGRMIAATEGDITVEAAASFNHPCTVHKISVESDWYTGSADEQPYERKDKGAINMGNQDYASGTFYKYFNINLNTLLKNKNNDLNEIKQILNWDYLKNFCIVVPSAHDNDKNANTRPDYICMVIRDDQPQQISFDKPIRLREDDDDYTTIAAKKIESDIEKWKDENTVFTSDVNKFDELLNELFA